MDLFSEESGQPEGDGQHAAGQGPAHTGEAEGPAAGVGPPDGPLPAVAEVQRLRAAQRQLEQELSLAQQRAVDEELAMAQWRADAAREQRVTDTLTPALLAEFDELVGLLRARLGAIIAEAGYSPDAAGAILVSFPAVIDVGSDMPPEIDDWGYLGAAAEGEMDLY
jgi:hypothetical protein